ncbi:uncharacterized protein LOC126812364 [Patella vulgata]|uniref:uncharacterized protein LOC126812364 n=1 Tax=Patella vulgata TaxID=6465 RepID=UPI00217F9FD8|nr:uncharacterized protein LOC126812364 [Patella vulgata]
MSSIVNMNRLDNLSLGELEAAIAELTDSYNSDIATLGRMLSQTRVDAVPPSFMSQRSTVPVNSPSLFSDMSRSPVRCQNQRQSSVRFSSSTSGLERTADYYRDSNPVRTRTSTPVDTQRQRDNMYGPVSNISTLASGSSRCSPESSRRARKADSQMFGFDRAQTADARPLQRLAKPIAMPPKYNGETRLNDYLVQFEVTAEINSWSEGDKARFLAISLTGKASDIFGTLKPTDVLNYHCLVEALKQKFDPPELAEMHKVQLRERRRRNNESLSEFAQAVHRLVYSAYPRSSEITKEEMAKDHFIQYFGDSQMRMLVSQARPRDLNAALHHAMELEAIKHSDPDVRSTHVANAKPKSGKKAESESSELHKMIASLKEELKEVKEKLRELENKISDRKRRDLSEETCFNFSPAIKFARVLVSSVYCRAIHFYKPIIEIVDIT